MDSKVTLLDWDVRLWFGNSEDVYKRQIHNNRAAKSAVPVTNCRFNWKTGRDNPFVTLVLPKRRGLRNIRRFSLADVYKRQIFWFTISKEANLSIWSCSSFFRAFKSSSETADHSYTVKAPAAQNFKLRLVCGEGFTSEWKNFDTRCV